MTVPSEFEDILEKAGFAHVATLGPDGEPQSTPVWYAWDGNRLKFSLTRRRQKLRNIQREPRIALSIQDPENPYRYIEIRGRVAAIDDDPDYAFINSLAKKYMGADEYTNDQPDDERVVVQVEPEHTTHMG